MLKSMLVEKNLHQWYIESNCEAKVKHNDDYFDISQSGLGCTCAKTVTIDRAFIVLIVHKDTERSAS